MVTIPLLGESPLRFAAGFLHLVGLFFRRADSAGDIYPDDDTHGQIAGTAPERILVMGERGEINLGVVTNELSIAAFFARAHHEVTGRGSEWAIATFPRDRIAGGEATVSRCAPDVSRTDLVVIIAGITDSLTLVSANRWGRRLSATITALLAELPIDAHIVIAEIPPLGNAGSLSRVARLVAGRRSAALNKRTRALTAANTRVLVVPFPDELTDRLWVPQSQEQRYTRTYSLWSRGLMAAVEKAWHHHDVPADHA
jgi:hypothetical protein